MSDIEYFMARTVMSGISGNISKGRLVNDQRLVNAADAAVASILNETRETMHGLIAVDFREARDERPMITEINLRHVAATYSFAAAGFNLAEAQLLLTLGKIDEVGPQEATYCRAQHHSSGYRRRANLASMITRRWR